MKFIAATLLGASVLGKVVEKARTHTEEEYWAGWLKFHAFEEVIERTHGYPDKLEHDHRFEIFKDNMEEIKRHNSLGLSWTKGITPFADMTPEEFKAHIGGCVMGEKPEATFGVFSAKEGVELPDSVDWDAKGAVTPVKNQGSCGSCWAFSTTGAIEGRCQIANGNLVSLAEQDLVDCDSTDSGCSGGLMDYAFAFVKRNGGLCKEDDYEYIAEEHSRCEENGCKKHGQISGYTDVKSDSTASLMAACANGPVAIAIEADQEAFQLYNGGVMDKNGCGPNLDHGVLVVGYGEESGKKFWKVKNSWGGNWGEHGYIKLCRDCGKNNGAGQCGILSQPSFPTCA